MNDGITISAPAAEAPGRPTRKRGTSRFQRENPREAEPEAQREARPTGRLQRKRTRSDDRFHINRAKEIPPGMDWEWKRESCVGQKDLAHISNLAENHWKPVGEEQRPGKPVRLDGMILMQRPSYLSEEAAQEDFEIAIEQVQGVSQKMSSTPHNTMTRDHPSVRANSRINRSYEPMPVLKE